MAEGLGALFGEVYGGPADLQIKVTSDRAVEQRLAQAKKLRIKQNKELQLLQAVQEKQIKAFGSQKGVNINLKYEDISRDFARGQDIADLIYATLSSHGEIPFNVPVTVLQNTNPPTTCYMNSVLQCVASLPGFFGAESWPLINFNANDTVEVKGAEATEAFQELLEAMREQPPRTSELQEAFLRKQATFYTRMYEYTKAHADAIGGGGGERLYPLVQSDADTFRTLLFELLTKQNLGPKKGIRTLDEPAGHFMLQPLFGFMHVVTAVRDGLPGPALEKNWTMESLLQVAVPPISFNEKKEPGGLNAFINDLNEKKSFRYLPDTLIFSAEIFGFEGKYADPIPIVPEFDMRTYHQPNWEPINAGSNVYRLHAIVCHHGETIAAGHYTALVLRDGMWFHINDAPPSATYIEDLPAMLPAHVETLENANPYIFFYVRDGTGPYVVNDDGTSVAVPPAGGGGGGRGGGGGAVAPTGPTAPTRAAARGPAAPTARGPAAPTARGPAAPRGVDVINAGGGWSRLVTPSSAETKTKKERKRGRKTRKRSKH